MTGQSEPYPTNDIPQGENPAREESFAARVSAEWEARLEEVRRAFNAAVRGDPIPFNPGVSTCLDDLEQARLFREIVQGVCEGRAHLHERGGRHAEAEEARNCLQDIQLVMRSGQVAVAVLLSPDVRKKS